MKTMHMKLNVCELIQSNFEKFFEIMSTSTINTPQFKCVISSVPHPYYNSVIHTNIHEEDIDNVISDIKSHYRNHKSGHCWWLNDLTQPKSLADHLVSHGYKHGEQFIGLSYDLSDYAVVEETDNDFMVIHLTEVEQLTYWTYPFLEHNQYKNLMGRKIFERYSDLFDKEKRLIHLVVFKKQQPVGCGSILITDDYAGLYNGGINDHINQDKIIKMLKIARLNLAKKIGCKTVVLQLPETTYKEGFYNDFQRKMVFDTYLS